MFDHFAVLSPDSPAKAVYSSYRSRGGGCQNFLGFNRDRAAIGCAGVAVRKAITLLC